LGNTKKRSPVVQKIIICIVSGFGEYQKLGQLSAISTNLFTEQVRMGMCKKLHFFVWLPGGGGLSPAASQLVTQLVRIFDHLYHRFAARHDDSG
jgi:hypothetical protein